ncbi:accessory gene regulator ArgB-like protein [Parasporobacterium paucivorans]|uniref:Accessory gene regulator B n=1 Tax=Parasporobacterium paucivorans DSM 15970 TaxID=1122934 RepID=A0A1M6GF98_9FIRM|nr:accessory gene regulator B family protein [Parasporobacterium paucivorans]SHJ08644.1 accessory gene regulator B [Parasporobacterium paucivorans DSM 15970]
MASMERWAKRTAERISLQMKYDEDKKAVIAYGLTAMIQMATIFVIISIFGLFFGFWMESVVIFLGVGIIRKSTGGAHSATMLGCILISVSSISLLSAAARYIFDISINIYLNCFVSIFIYLLCFVVFYLRVPVDTPNKPIVKPEKIKRLRKQSFLILTAFFLLSMVCVFLTGWNTRFFSLAVIIRLTMLWQALTLTRLGQVFFAWIDVGFRGVSA